MTLRAPFPWYGGKSMAAPLIWRALGNVPNYVEPFAGSLAALLARPGGAGKVETANDKDGLIANFWRATRDNPDDVARWADSPVNEADLHARHLWLVKQAPALFEKLVADPEYFDAKIAGWWVWGICTWIGGGWCHEHGARRPMLNNANGHGLLAVQRQIPAIGQPGSGLHAPTTEQKRPRNARGATGLIDIHGGMPGAVAWLNALAQRLRNVRVCCGDWSRVVGRSSLGIDTAHGMSPCGLLFDPPYDQKRRRKKIYAEDKPVAEEVREWCIENGDNDQLRIVLCGLEGEHEMPSSWRCVAWAPDSTSPARAAERVWLSPHCLPIDVQLGLFAEAG
jgi:hypothetical protein